MEIKIGIVDSPRELVFESADDTKAIESEFERAQGASDILKLSDDKGRKYLVPVKSVAYVEIGPEEVRKVGFGA